MGKSNTELLKIAESYLNQGGSKFRKFAGLPSWAAYCQAFVCDIANEGGDASLYYDGKVMTYCPTGMSWCAKNLAQIPPYLALPMDVIYFDWEPNGVPNHVGFVRERKDADEIYTVEGNTSRTDKNGKVLATGVVANKTRVAKYVCGIYRPHFKPAEKIDTSKALTVDGYFGYNSIAMLQKVLMVKVDAILGIGTVKALQKFVGITADGSWGTKTSKAVQKLIGVDQDGKFGAKSVKALQKWLNKQAGFTSASSQTTKPTEPTTSTTNKTEETKPVEPVKVTYGGTLPSITVKETKEVSNANKVLDKAKELAWAKGTAEKKYAYKGGSATSAFKKALDAVFPSHTKWGKAPSKGASCDVAAATIVRASGLDTKMPRGYTEQLSHKASSKMEKLTYKNCTPYSVSKPGDMILYTKNESGSSRHVLVRGDGVLYEAQYENTYLHINTSLSKIKKTRPKTVIFRAKPTKQTVSREYLMKGDTGTAVGNLQKFLNWYGNYGLEIDKSFGDKTEAAVKDFQKKEGTKEVTGKFGEESLAKAKAVKK